MTRDAEQTTDEQIDALVARLSRPHPSGGRVIERAAIMAAGADSAAVMRWIEDANWLPEEAIATPSRSGSGLHGMRQEADRGQARPQAPRRYVSPPPADRG